ncbi:hypothetical protein DL766_007816 [Monosporascus sp. MC13-8B]|uniref:Uncharacterized protein n=1 Tax=Monosporascus cannonballus TaxID=155416 RepID=A0ABY0H2Y1_9PEZI|nr:hypothetical protein DL762_007657 [Monosporascus cannonballus]RYP21967.1 hypothetical protein DL766_007816 [Monosporascus sp. MC13-8B]
MSRQNPQTQYTGVWRSMYLPTSSKPADVVYSIMGIFKLQIDPFRKNRDPRYLFNDLARKTATKLTVGPAWLTVGGVTGCDIPHDGDSRIVPKFPHPETAGKESNNHPPQMVFNAHKSKEWVGYHVDDSQWYIKKYNIRFLSQSHLHIINAVMLMSDAKSTITTQKVLRVTPLGPPNPTRDFYGNFVNAASRKLRAVLVGEVGDMTKEPGRPKLNLSTKASIKLSPVNYRGKSYFLFMDYPNRHWRVVGDGVFHAQANLFINRSRSIFTIGTGAQKALSSWPTHSKTWFNARTYAIGHSYGIEPLDD